MQDRMIGLLENSNEEFYPILTRIKVRVDKVEEKTQGGIVIPKDVREREMISGEKGTVVYVGTDTFQGWGDGRKQVAIGDRVAFLRHAGVIIKEGEDDYRFLNDQDIVAIGKVDYDKKQADEV